MAVDLVQYSFLYIIIETRHPETGGDHPTYTHTQKSKPGLLKPIEIQVFSVRSRDCVVIFPKINCWKKNSWNLRSYCNIDFADQCTVVTEFHDILICKCLFCSNPQIFQDFTVQKYRSFTQENSFHSRSAPCHLLLWYLMSLHGFQSPKEFIYKFQQTRERKKNKISGKTQIERKERSEITSGSANTNVERLPTIKTVHYIAFQQSIT